VTFCDERSGCFVAVEVRRGMGLYGPKHRDFFGEIYKQSNIKTSVSDSLGQRRHAVLYNIQRTYVDNQEGN
jgi:hypothetical protein